MRLIWLLLGLLSLGLGIVGAFLPLLPTVPLLLLAAFFFARSSDRLHNWLVSHKTWGPPIRDWSERGAIGRKPKVYASASILVTFGISIWLGLSAGILVVQAVVLSAVSVFIWSRPEH